MVRYYYDGINTLLERQRYWNDFYDEWRWRTLRVYTLAPAAMGQIAGERTMTAWHPQTGAPTAWAQGGAADAWADRWYYYDMLGNVTGELDASGLVQSHIWMEAFGTVLSGGQTGRRLTTKTYDPAAGLYYFSARWLSPDAGLFLTIDPLSRVRSEYHLVDHNPLKYVDPTALIKEAKSCHGNKYISSRLVQALMQSACAQAASVVTQPSLRDCIQRQCQNADLTIHCSCKCVPGNDPTRHLGWGDVGSRAVPKENIWLCFDHFGGKPRAVQRGRATWIDVIIHELAHTCGWYHFDGGGVPGDDGTIP
jgi:RHS repeat-associated protein